MRPTTNGRIVLTYHVLDWLPWLVVLLLLLLLLTCLGRWWDCSVWWCARTSLWGRRSGRRGHPRDQLSESLRVWLSCVSARGKSGCAWSMSCAPASCDEIGQRAHEQQRAHSRAELASSVNQLNFLPTRLSSQPFTSSAPSAPCAASLSPHLSPDSSRPRSRSRTRTR